MLMHSIYGKSYPSSARPDRSSPSEDACQDEDLPRRTVPKYLLLFSLSVNRFHSEISKPPNCICIDYYR